MQHISSVAKLLFMFKHITQIDFQRICCQQELGSWKSWVIYQNCKWHCASSSSFFNGRSSYISLTKSLFSAIYIFTYLVWYILMLVVVWVLVVVVDSSLMDWFTTYTLISSALHMNYWDYYCIWHWFPLTYTGCWSNVWN